MNAQGYKLLDAVFETARENSGFSGRWLEPHPRTLLDLDGLLFSHAAVQVSERSFRYIWIYPDGGSGEVVLDVNPIFAQADLRSPFGTAKLLTRPARNFIEGMVATAWNVLVSDFNEQIATSAWIVSARPKSPLDDYRDLASDVWCHFSPVDWFRGVVECDVTGERLFSVSARPDTSHVHVPISDDDAIAIVRKEYERRAIAGETPMTTRETEAWMKARGLSRGIARAARETIPAEHKLKPGEKRSDRKRIKT